MSGISPGPYGRELIDMAERWEVLADTIAEQTPEPGSPWARQPDSESYEVWQRGLDLTAGIIRACAGELRRSGPVVLGL